MKIVESRFPYEFNIFTTECNCGVRKVLDFSFVPKWQCHCGRWWYVDPAGRIWGTQALLNAGMICQEEVMLEV